MKIVINSILLILLICFLSIMVESQITEGPNLDIGFVRPEKRDELKFDVTNYTIGTGDMNRVYERYEYSFLRVHLKNKLNGLHFYIDFHPRVDEFTTLRIPNTNFLYTIVAASNESIDMDRDQANRISAELVGFKDITTYSNQWVNVSRPCWENGTMATNSQCNGTAVDDIPMKNWYVKEFKRTHTTRKLSLQLPEKRLLEYSTATFVSPFVIVVQLDKGKIVDAMWDGDRLPDMCKQCDVCIDNQCGSFYDNMDCDVNPENCELKILVAWAGVDKYNSVCRSFNKIPSTFAQYSSTPYQQVGRGVLNDFLYRATVDKNPNQA